MLLQCCLRSSLCIQLPRTAQHSFSADFPISPSLAKHHHSTCCAQPRHSGSCRLRSCPRSCTLSTWASQLCTMELQLACQASLPSSSSPAQLSAVIPPMLSTQSWITSSRLRMQARRQVCLQKQLRYCPGWDSNVHSLLWWLALPREPQRTASAAPQLSSPLCWQAGDSGWATTWVGTITTDELLADLRQARAPCEHTEGERGTQLI